VKTGIQVIIGIEMKSDLRDKLAFKPDQPDFCLAVLNARPYPVNFPFGNITDVRGTELLRPEIYKMLKAALHPDDQFLKIMSMRLIGNGLYFPDILLVQFLYGKKLFHLRQDREKMEEEKALSVKP
jgi:hypothetical protein